MYIVKMLGTYQLNNMTRAQQLLRWATVWLQ